MLNYPFNVVVQKNQVAKILHRYIYFWSLYTCFFAPDCKDNLPLESITLNCDTGKHISLIQIKLIIAMSQNVIFSNSPMSEKNRAQLNNFGVKAEKAELTAGWSLPRVFSLMARASFSRLAASLYLFWSLTDRSKQGQTETHKTHGQNNRQAHKEKKR